MNLAHQELWENDGHLALHHDLTNCLRIADLTEFTDDMWLREIKRKPAPRRRRWTAPRQPSMR